jgi:hypothetical protein
VERHFLLLRSEESADYIAYIDFWKSIKESGFAQERKSPKLPFGGFSFLQRERKSAESAEKCEQKKGGW